MIKPEYFGTFEDGSLLYRRYSDEGLMIRKVGTDEVYVEAIDAEDAPCEYEETDIVITINVESTPHEYEETDVAIATNGEITDGEEE